MELVHHLEILDTLSSLESYRNELRSLLLIQWQGKSSPQVIEEIKSLRKSLLWDYCELAHALLLLNCLLCGISHKDVELEQTSSGAVLLHKKQHFAWGGIPYPRWHAELGGILTLLSIQGKTQYREIALKMGFWQKELIDHRGLPLFSAWAQEGSVSFSELIVSYFFLFRNLMELQQGPFENLASHFESLLKDINIEESPFTRLSNNFPSHPFKNEKREPKKVFFVDSTVGFIKQMHEESTCSLFGSGCKSGMGLFLHGEGGIVNFGPQKLPLGDCKGFGVVSASPLQQEEKFVIEPLDKEEAVCCYTVKIAEKSKRVPLFHGIEDGGFSGLWIEAKHHIRDNELYISSSFTGCASLKDFAFVFFVKARAVYVAKNQKLHPCSFDRYIGPSQEIILDIGDKTLMINILEEGTAMEVIPLGGGDNFWSADFLIAYTLHRESYSWQIKPKTQNLIDYI